MRKKFTYCTIFFLLVTASQYYFFSDIKLSVGAFTDIITFLSIVFGFYITSLAIFVTSRYVSDLYKITDKNNSSVTLLHTLTNNYKFGLMLTLSSLIYFIAVQLFISSDSTIPFNQIAVLPTLALLFLNFFFCFRLVNDLVNIIIQEGKRG